MARTLRWGILGTGNIAAQFTDGVAGSERCAVAAVGSRSAKAAQAFADRNQLQRSYGSYRELVEDDAIDAVYVSLPNALHHEWTLRALEAGKHVLCEKPFAVTVAEAQEMFAAAQQRGLLLVEAFMYRSHPQTHAVLRHLREGAIGKLKLIRASFCFCTTAPGSTDPGSNIRFNRELAGGGLMDVGCYCVDFARLVSGEEPIDLHVSAHMHERGVDDLAAGTLVFPSGAVCSFVCGMTLHTDNAALVCGDGGYIHVPIPWKPPVKGAQYSVATMTPPKMDKRRAKQGPTRQTYTVDAGKPLYALEADDFAAAVFDGAQPAVTQQDTLGTLQVLEKLRQQAGLTF